MTEIPKGEFLIKIFTNFSEEDFLPHDWSLVTWSDKSALTITHDDGIKSDSFRNIAPNSSIPIP
jgi:hypothetical protein